MFVNISKIIISVGNMIAENVLCTNYYTARRCLRSMHSPGDLTPKLVRISRALTERFTVFARLLTQIFTI